MLEFIKENREVIVPVVSSVLCVIFTLIITNAINNKNNRKLVNKKLLSELQSENNSLKNELEKYTAIEKATDGNYIILKETNTPICPTCWGKDKNPIPIYDDGRGKYKCNICGTSEVYSNLGVEKEKEKQNEATNEMAQVCKAYNNYFDRNGYF